MLWPIEAATFVAATPLLRRTAARRRSSSARAARLHCRRCIDRSPALVHPRPGIRHPPVATGRQHRPYRGHHDGHQIAAERVGRATPTYGQHRGLEPRRHVCRAPLHGNVPTSSVRSSRWAARIAWSRATRPRRRRCGSASSTSTMPTSTSTGSPNRRDRKLAVPATSVYSRRDGVAPWQTCIDEVGPLAENIEVYSSHASLGVHPAVTFAVLDRLRLPEGQWRPFRAPCALRLWYPRPVSWRAEPWPRRPARRRLIRRRCR